jgi:putative FmdB family regulatory protein
MDSEQDLEYYHFEFECDECGHEWRAPSSDSEFEASCPACESEDTNRDLLRVITDPRLLAALVDGSEDLVWPGVLDADATWTSPWVEDPDDDHDDSNDWEG